jgi:hypothetical protein
MLRRGWLCLLYNPSYVTTGVQWDPLRRTATTEECDRLSILWWMLAASGDLTGLADFYSAKTFCALLENLSCTGMHQWDL